MTAITINDGKYTLQEGVNGELKALRYGDEWRDCSSDTVVKALFTKLKQIQNAPESIDLEAIEIDEKPNCVMSLKFEDVEIWQETTGRLCANIDGKEHDVCGDNLVYYLTVRITDIGYQKTEIKFC